MRKLLISTALLLALTGAATAQQGSLLQQSGSRLDAATNVALGTNFNTVNSQSVATATATGGQYVYVTGISLEECGDGTGTAATNVNFTSTGLVGTPSWNYSATTGTSVSTCTRQVEVFATPLKGAAPGTNVVITSPSALLHTGFGIRIYFYLAP
jgi:hypothetical protein